MKYSATKQVEQIKNEETDDKWKIGQEILKKYKKIENLEEYVVALMSQVFSSEDLRTHSIDGRQPNKGMPVKPS